MLAFFLTAAADARARAGAPELSAEDRQRLTALFVAHHEVVWRVLRRTGLDAARADDGVQQVFMVALNRLGDLTQGKERAFLCATAVIVARKWKTAPLREVMPDELPEVEGSSRPDDETETRRNRERLDRILKLLDENLRVVFVLQEVEGLSKSETAEALGIPQGTVATRLRRARIAFDQLLRDDLGRADP